MTTVICSDCGQVSIESSRTMVLPFVCAGCQTVDDPRLPTSHHDADPSDCHVDVLDVMTEVKQPPYEDENGKLWNYNPVTDEWDIPVLAEGTPTLSDDTATTAATVELISDLESQLTAAKELSEARTELIEELEEQNSRLQYIAAAFAFYYGYATERMKHLEHKNEVLEEGIGFRDTLIRVLQEYGGLDLVVTQS